MLKPSPPLLDPEQAALIQGGVSMHVASCSGDQRPGGARAVGCRVSADRHSVTLLVSRLQGASLLEDIRDNGRIAVVFSVMLSHRTIQLKGSDARIEAPLPGDKQVTAGYADAFVSKLQEIGYQPGLMRHLVLCPAEDLAAITFTVTEAWSQTPGPGAGAPLKVGA